ncbi:PREDICTED: uncharacterized protein LOC105460806 [Wasmannia auropunctata]|uniref:uncharacterized protein LOC105460806 n=1 Tax=Wasmannia auropunctata TaxID=64793 RepID=UPI0005EE29A5|nr:PREDICTED: uncharacterized protein LOC105460806 [Wasmannia auropunctata]
MFNLKIQKYKIWKRWWLFHAMDFQSLMYPCFTFCRVLGMFPYKINASTFEASKPRYILSTVIVGICGIYDLILIYNFIYKIDLGDVTKTLEAVCYYTFSCFIVIVTHILSGPKMRLLQTILKISSKLPPKSYQKLSRLIHVKDIFGTIFLFMQICFYFSKQRMFEINYLTALPVVFTVYLTLLEFQINMLYMNCICVLKNCFKTINKNVTHMKKLVVNDITSCVPTVIYKKQRNQHFLMKLTKLKKQHMIVSDTVQMLNVIFSPQLLATIFMFFCNITFEMYSYVVRWQDGILIEIDTNFLDVFLISITLNIFKITLLIWACETGKNQAREIGTTIHDVLNSTSNEQIKNELQLFSLQILHRGNTFSTKGLTIDATLVTTVSNQSFTLIIYCLYF